MISKLKYDSFLNNAGLFLLTALWSYAVCIKLADLAHYKNQMAQQPFAPIINSFLLYLIPIAETFVAILLIMNKKSIGLYVSLILLIGFTIYIFLILGHFFPKKPCSCGGFISKMSWKHHLYFNLLLITINAYCLYYLTRTERRFNGETKI